MLTEFPTLSHPLLEGIASINDRPLPEGPLPLELGTEVVSADSHWMVTEDIFFENFPARMKDQAPRIWHEDYWRIGKREGQQVWSPDPKVHNAVMKANLQSAWSHENRRAHLADPDTVFTTYEVVQVWGRTPGA